MGCRNSKIPYEVFVPSKISESDSVDKERSKGFQHVYLKLSSCQPKLPEDTVIQLAEILSSKHKLKEVLLTHLLLQSGEESAENEERFDTNTRHRNTVGARGLVARVMYSKLKNDGSRWTMEKAFSEYVDEFAYGPVEAAVQIGNVLLTWDHTSLVIPQLLGEEGGTSCASPQLSPTLLRRGSQSTPGESSPHCNDYDVHTDIPLTSHEDLDQVMENVIHTVVTYNTEYRYGLFSRNCQHFVRSILRAMGIQNHKHFFPSQVRNHSQVLQKRGCRVNVEEFNSHTELDNYVRPHIDEMDSDDIRFCYSSYLLFHAMGSSVLSQGREKGVWKCDRERCQFKEVEKRY